MDELKVFFVSAIIVLVLIFGAIVSIQAINVNFYDNVPSEVYVDEELVYKGTSAGFDVESSGYATTVTVMGGFLYFFPKEYYTSKDVRIVGKK